MRGAFKRLFREGDLFLALGRDMADRLRAAGCPEEKVRIQHLAVDVERIAFRPRQWPGDGERVVVLYCGRLVEKKGILCALEAFARLAGRWKDLEFRVVGGGPLRPAVEQAVRRMDLQDRVVLRGALPHAEAMKEMRDAHLFILPSLTAPDGDMEGTPTVLMEAQASGLPVVSTHHADIPEVALDGETGFLVPERDSQALAERLGHLLRHPDIWPDFGRAGRRHVEQRYNIHREAPKLEALYAGLIGV
jgi:colanic acid/amylovoran biosynthesis glycosyltransferase